METLNDTKVDDILFYLKGINYGFNSYKYFYLPVRVTKVTATQITCQNNERYKKDTGRRIGATGYGDRIFIGNEEVIDQTEDMKIFMEKVKLSRKAVDITYNLDKIRNRIDPDTDNVLLKEYIIIAEQLYKTIKEGE